MASALASARVAVTSVKAPSALLRALMRLSVPCAISRALIAPVRTAAAIACADPSRSFAVTP